MERNSTSLPSRSIFFVILFLVPISQFSLDIFSPSLPKIKENLATTDSSVQHTITVFLLAVGLGQYFFGVLADSFGRKKMLFLGMFLFTFSSVMCVFSASISFLIFARFLQGFGCSSIAVLSKAVTVDLYEGKELMKASALIGLIWGTSPIIAPVIGGYLDTFGWRWSFVSLSIYGLICLILTQTVFKETLKIKTPFHIRNTFYQSLKILKNRDFFCCTIIISSTNLGIFIFNLMGPFFIQTVVGKSSVFYGYMALIVGLSYLLGAFLSRFVIDYFKAETVILYTINVLFGIGLSAVVLSFFYPKSIFMLMFISSAIAFVSGFLYPYLVKIMFEPFNNISGVVSSNYGILSYGFSSIFAFVLSAFTVTSTKQMAVGYCVVSFICFVCAQYLIFFSRKYKEEDKIEQCQPEGSTYSETTKQYSGLPEEEIQPK